MTDTELRDLALAALKKTTISYPNWLSRLQQGKYADVTQTEWWRAMDALGKIGGQVTPPPPPASGSLDVYRHTIYPGPYIAAYPGGENHAWHWLIWKQPTVETFLTTSTNQADMGTIRWEPGGLHQGRETWVIASLKCVQGSPGRWLDFHQHGSDAPKGYNYCNERGTSCGIAPLALDWYRGANNSDGTSGLLATVQPCELERWPYHFQALAETETQAAMGQWLDFVIRVRWGRSDEGGRGVLQVWTNGVLKVNEPSIQTYWPGEGMCTLWQGGYWNVGVSAETVFESTPYRVGRTYAEALAQRPVLAGPGWGSRGQDGRNATATKVGTRALSEFKLPAGL